MHRRASGWESRRSCAASTTSSRSAPGKLYVDGEFVGYRQHGDKIYELRDREVCRKRAEIGMVFQRFNLFPHMTALENVMEAPVKVKRESKGVVRERAGQSLLDRVGLAKRKDSTRASSPAASSSGWRSRVPLPCSRN